MKEKKKSEQIKKQEILEPSNNPPKQIAEVLFVEPEKETIEVSFREPEKKTVKNWTKFRLNKKKHNSRL